MGQEYQEQKIELTIRQLDEIKKIERAKGVGEGNAHSTPSPETINMFKSMGEQFNDFKKEIKNEISTFGEKVDEMQKQINKSNISVIEKMAEIPSKIMEAADKKYASKILEIDLEKLKDSHEKLKEKQEERNYEWLKHLITAIISFGIAILLATKFK